MTDEAKKERLEQGRVEAKAADAWAIVHCGTSQGDIVWEVYRHWSPHGYERFVDLMEQHFYDDSHFFRVLPHFLVQFGLGYDVPADLQHTANQPIPDDPQLQPPIPFMPGILSYAGSGPNSRTSQVFISYGSAASLGREKWETPVGLLVHGLEKAAMNFYADYGDMPPWGKGPEQQKIRQHGRSYIDENFDKLDHFNSCQVHRHEPGTTGHDAHSMQRELEEEEGADDGSVEEEMEGDDGSAEEEEGNGDDGASEESGDGDDSQNSESTSEEERGAWKQKVHQMHRVEDPSERGHHESGHLRQVVSNELFHLRNTEGGIIDTLAGLAAIVALAAIIFFCCCSRRRKEAAKTV